MLIIMKALVVHNSDKIKDVFIGETEQELIDKLLSSKYRRDVLDRIADSLSEEEADAKANHPIMMDEITRLYHDGDSQDGYTILECK